MCTEDELEWIGICDVFCHVSPGRTMSGEDAVECVNCELKINKEKEKNKWIYSSVSMIGRGKIFKNLKKEKEKECKPWAIVPVRRTMRIDKTVDDHALLKVQLQNVVSVAKSYWKYGRGLQRRALHFRIVCHCHAPAPNFDWNPILKNISYKTSNLCAPRHR